MNYLEEVPFKTPLGSLEKPVGVVLVTAPQITVPDYLQILRDTEYEFTLENWVLTGLQDGYPREAQRAPRPPLCGEAPSCPPYWLMFSGPPESRLAKSKSSDHWALIPRVRSHSLSSADARCRNRVRHLVSRHEDEAGYSEDDEGSSTDDGGPRPSQGERPRTAPKRTLSRLEGPHFDSSADRSYPGSPRDPPHHRASPLTSSSSSSSPCRQPLRSVLEQSRPSSPLGHGQRQSRMRQRPLYSAGRMDTSPAPCPSRLQQQRPSSAGPVVKHHRNRALRFRSSRDLVLDSSAELLSALSEEERDLLEAITEYGYPLRTAILALERTGYRSPEKIMSYLVASDRLCELGYDVAQVEEALEMFQNCERKAAEFLRLLTQFNEMGFQQSAIKEVLLVHENHREKALEELMTRVA